MKVVLRLTLRVQGIFYVLAGAWPIVHPRMFLAITGPKTDIWLVHMVGALSIVIGAVLFSSANDRRRRVPPQIIALAAGSAIAFVAIDIVYTRAGVLRPVYRVDAALEALFAVIVLIASWWRRREDLRTL